MKIYSLLLSTLLFVGCSDSGTNVSNTLTKAYPLHKDIIVTVFWVGEEADVDNGNIANLASAWDNNWLESYGGVDTPDARSGYHPTAFIPKENPFYFALPYNDFDADGKKKVDSNSTIPWDILSDNPYYSSCKNRWIKITKGSQVVYAQWEDVGPFGKDDTAYVFGASNPKNSTNAKAGLDVSPAVRDYLGLSDVDSVNWEFVDASNVPDGIWKERVTYSNVNWDARYKPDVNTSWQWQLSGEINSNYAVDLYDIDLFESNTTLIQSLQKSGKKVICYFSAGSYEEWRADASSFDADILGKDLDGWAGERWLDIRSDKIRPIMQERLDLAEQKGCDGVEPDNMDNYSNDTGFNLTAEHQLSFNKFIANEARKRGLSVGLKNDISQMQALEPYFDFSVNEQCHKYSECSEMKIFTKVDKPVFNAEYAEEYINAPESMCKESQSVNIRTLILPLSLDDSFRYSCD